MCVPRSPKPWGKNFYQGDVVGCGIDYTRQYVFYTLNGEFLGVAFRFVAR